MSKNNNTPVIIGIAFAAVIAFVIGLNYAGKDGPEAKTVIQGPISLKKGLVAYYPFNKNTRDESGSNNHANADSPLFCKDRFGVSDSAYRIIGEANILTNEISRFSTNNFSYAFWIKTSSNTRLYKETNLSYGLEGAGLNIAVDAVHGGNDTYAGIGVIAGNNGLMVYEHAHAHYCPPLVAKDVNLSEWNHVVVTVENNRTKLYLGGRFIKEGIESKRQVIASTKIGGRWRDDAVFKGELDELRFYNRPLSLDEVKALYEWGKPKNE
jgi:hypothetical protein